jgi:hypothetical protein
MAYAAIAANPAVKLARNEFLKQKRAQRESDWDLAATYMMPPP